MIIEKHTKNNGILLIKEIKTEVAKKWVIEKHYSGKWNTSFGKINFGIFRDNVLLGVAVYGNLMNPKSHKNITDLGASSVIELNRLHVSDVLIKNAESVFLSSTFKIIRSEYPDVKFINTFADGRLGCGTIYKACNFKYYGFHETLFFEDINTKESHHKVPFENTKRPKKMLELSRLFLDEKLKPFKTKTYRYIFPLYKKHKIKMNEVDYPKYDIGLNYLHNYIHPIGLMSRLIIMYDFISDKKYKQLAIDKLFFYGFSFDEIKTEIENQKKNKSIVWLLSGGYPKEKLVQSLKMF